MSFFDDVKASRGKEQHRTTSWNPQAGSQEMFLRCPIYEVLYEGTRGPGKTDALIMDFAQHVGQGWGADWRGILFRRTFPELSDVIAKTTKWFKLIWPQAEYNKADHTWTWPTGEQLLLRHMSKESDYYAYHGHAYPWIGWEELTTWPTDKCYKVMMSCSRSTRAGMPRKVRSTTNPYGVGHNWVKSRWRLPTWRRRPITEPGEPARVAIHGHISENRLLLEADPDYIDRLRAAARNPSELAAWMDGSWEIVSGGMFDDVFSQNVHILPPVRPEAMPRGWRLDRAFDWGSSKPFSVGWFAESNGEPMVVEGRKIGGVRGDIIMFGEWYGWNGKRNEGVRMLATEIADGIKDREKDWGIANRCLPGPADTSIWDEENGNSVAKDFAKKKVRWERADKGPGSRKQGWEQLRKLLFQARPLASGAPREMPGFFVTRDCLQWIETVPTLARSDKDPDDVDTDAEDHAADMTRYRTRGKKTAVVKQRGF